MIDEEEYNWIPIILISACLNAYGVVVIVRMHQDVHSHNWCRIKFLLYVQLVLHNVQYIMWIIAYAVDKHLTGTRGVELIIGWVIGLFFLAFWFSYVNNYIKNGKIL